jgi:endoglucanase
MMNRRRFLGTTAVAAVTAALHPRDLPAATAATQGAPGRVLQAKGFQIMDGEQPVRLRGVNLGGWMLIEDYIIGLPWTEWKIREQFRRNLGEESYSAFFNAYMESYISEADISFLAKKGFNFVRLPFNYRHFESDLAPGQWLEDGFRCLENVVQLCHKYNLWVLLDLHAAPGAQARDQNAGSAYGEAYLWHHKYFMDRTAAFWKELARRYKGNTTIAGYNLLCEPVTYDVPLLNQFYTQIIRAIREVDPNHIIALDPNHWAKDICSLQDRLFEDPQVIPAIHHYYSDDEAFAQATSYPGSVNGKVCDRAALERTLNGKHDERRIPRPTMVGEFGVDITATQPFAVQLAITRDLISIFEEKGWSWSMWCYKDLRQMGIVNPRSDTSWRKFLDSDPIAGFFKKYQQLEPSFTEAVGKMLSATEIDQDTREQWAREVARDFNPPALDYVLRKLQGKSPAELAAMARSFAFGSCDVREDQLGVLTPFLKSS